VLADFVGAIAEFFVALVPDRQPWRGIVLAFFVAAVVGALVALAVVAT